MTATKQRYLRAMDVDIWVRRGFVAGTAECSPVDELPHVASQPDDRPGIHLVFVAYNAVGMVFSMPGDDRVTSCQRLCDDIARAIMGSQSKGKFSELKCSPMDDASPADAVRHRLASLPERIIVFGDIAGDYIHGGELYEVLHRFDKVVLGAPHIGDILDQPLRKRDVWQGLLKLQSM